jgi:hypothetical protein
MYGRIPAGQVRTNAEFRTLGTSATCKHATTHLLLLIHRVRADYYRIPLLHTRAHRYLIRDRFALPDIHSTMDNSKLSRCQNHLGSSTNHIFPDLSTAVHEAFASLVADNSLFALPFAWIDNTLHTLPPVQSNDSTTSFQNELNKLDAVLNPRTPLYLILRRKGSLVAVTFVPYLAKDAQRNFFLENRLDFVRQLGEEHFSQLLICKEIGEITDARSWIEREENGSLPDSASKHTKDTGTCDEEGCAECAVKDVGYKRNKCRLCDRRMKNKISPEALEAFKLLVSPGAMIQIVS